MVPVPRKWIKSKFIYQDADIILVSCYCVIDTSSSGTMTKFSCRRESSLTTSGSQKMESCLVLRECSSCRMYVSENRRSTKSVDFDILLSLSWPRSNVINLITGNTKRIFTFNYEHYTQSMAKRDMCALSWMNIRLFNILVLGLIQICLLIILWCFISLMDLTLVLKLSDSIFIKKKRRKWKVERVKNWNFGPFQFFELRGCSWLSNK